MDLRGVVRVMNAASWGDQDDDEEESGAAATSTAGDKVRLYPSVLFLPHSASNVLDSLASV